MMFSVNYLFAFSILSMTLGYAMGVVAHSMFFPARGIVDMRSRLLHLVCLLALMFITAACISYIN